MRKRNLALAALVVLLGACGDHDHDAAGEAADDHALDHAHEHSDTHEETQSFAFGAPGDPAAATRTIEVVADDPYRFRPGDVEVESGETVTFVVTNEGDQAHEFVLGDRAYQESHGKEMAAGGMHHEGNAVTVAPGATEELTWVFPPEGSVLYGCHVAGHYDGGMVGAISVSA
jgi:uncharacterized cupredoxin-like copper-binding protein